MNKFTTKSYYFLLDRCRLDCTVNGTSHRQTGNSDDVNKIHNNITSL